MDQKKVVDFLGIRLNNLTAEEILDHVDPVSYTHLDVYKRQGSNRAEEHFSKSWMEMTGSIQRH